MKRIFFALIIGFCVTSVFAQGKEAGSNSLQVIPDPVLKGFIKNYGDAKETWEIKDENYIATFKLIGMPATAIYDSSGQRLSIEVEIKSSQLPAIALSYIDRNYPKSRVTIAKKFTDDKKVSTFTAALKTSGGSVNLLFNARGDNLKDDGKK